LEVAPDVIGTRVDAQHKAPFIEQVGRDHATAGVGALGARGKSIEQVSIIRIEAGEDRLAARRHKVIPNAQAGNLV